MKFPTIVLLGLIAVSDVQALKIQQLEEPAKEEVKVEEKKADAKKESSTESEDSSSSCYDVPRGDKQSKCFKSV